MASDPGDQLSYTLSWGEQSVTTSDSQVQVDGLAPWTDYAFTVSVRDTDGHQAATDLTAQQTPDITPRCFRLAETMACTPWTSVKTAVVSWLNATDNVAVTGYTLSVDGGASSILRPIKPRVISRVLGPGRSIASRYRPWMRRAIEA